MGDDGANDTVAESNPENKNEQNETEEIVDKNIEFAKEFEALEKIKEREARSRAVTLEILGDLPNADAAPPNNVLFVCKLNPVTEAEDLKIIFSRFGSIKSCNVVKDYKTGESLQYAFIEFDEEESCTNAYFKMENVLIDDRRIHVDFCQSIPKLWNKYKSGNSTRDDYKNLTSSSTRTEGRPAYQGEYPEKRNRHRRDDAKYGGQSRLYYRDRDRDRDHRNKYRIREFREREK